MDPSKLNEIAEAITAGDIKRLIIAGSITEIPMKVNSRGRANKLAAQKAKGKRKGHGSRKGKKTARTPRKTKWISSVRALRNELRTLDGKEVDHIHYRKLYRKIKAGTFRSKAHLHLYLKEHDMIKKEAKA